MLEKAAQLLAESKPFALVTIVRTSGSTPRKAGAKMIVCESGELLGTVGGGRIEHEFAQEAKDALAAGEPRLVKRHTTHDLGMCCGGEMEAFIEPMGHRFSLVLVGAGHIHAALAPIAVTLGFRVTVADEMEEFASPERFPAPIELIHSFEPKDWPVALNRFSLIVVATRDHVVDQKVLEQLAACDAQPAYVGVVGSHGKLGRFRKRLEARGVSQAWLERLRGPVGVDVGAETPEEIAVAIAAELIAVRRRQ